MVKQISKEDRKQLIIKENNHENEDKIEKFLAKFNFSFNIYLCMNILFYYFL